ncbi:MAG: hypothetical protein WD824_22230 [Cyclobacteriaceae bacterium]
MKKILFGSLLVLFLAGMAQAQTTPAVDGRQAAQRSRINQGVASGEVTRTEAAELRSDQRRIKRAEQRVKADGNVTRNERVRLTRKQNQASRKIRREKHD